MTKKDKWGNSNAGEAVCLQCIINSEIKFFQSTLVMHMLAHAHRQAHTYEKTPDEKQTGSEFQTKDVEKNVKIFYAVVAVILKNLLAAGNNRLEYRLP